MADTMADTPMSRRGWRHGSVYQKCEARFGCPPLEADGTRPKHVCAGRWHGTIEAGYTANGTRRRVAVTAKTKTAVMRKLRDKRLEQERDGRAAVRRTITVAKWSEQWLAHIVTRVRPSAYDTDVAAMRWVVRSIGHVKLADLTPADVRSVAAHIRADGGKSSTALRYHGSLMRMLKAASLDGYNIPPNVLLAENPKKGVTDRQAVPLADVAKLLSVIVARTDGSRWSLALLQGIRQAEALGLTWDAVDLDAGTLSVSWQAKSLRYLDPSDRSKGFRVPDGYEFVQLAGATHLVRPKSTAGWRVQPLVPWAVNALREWREVAPDNPHGLVWPGRVTKAAAWPRNPATDRDEWAEIQKAAGVAHPSGRPYHVHEIRHSTATLLMELGVPESVRIAIMGHSSMASTHGYEHVDLTQSRIALESVARRLELD